MSSGRLFRIQREQDRNQAAHDMRIAIAAKFQHGSACAVRADVRGEPDLTGAAAYFIGLGMLGFRHWFERAANFDQVAITIVPIVEQREVIRDLVYRHEDIAISAADTTSDQPAWLVQARHSSII